MFFLRKNGFTKFGCFGALCPSFPRKADKREHLVNFGGWGGVPKLAVTVTKYHPPEGDYIFNLISNIKIPVT